MNHILILLPKLATDSRIAATTWLCWGYYRDLGRTLVVR